MLMMGKQEAAVVKQATSWEENRLRTSSEKRPAEYDEQVGSKQLKSRKEQNKSNSREDKKRRREQLELETSSDSTISDATPQRYIKISIGGEVVADAPRVKKKPVKNAASKKRPATDAAAKPVVKKKRNTKSKSVSAKKTLEILPVAQEAVPLQMIAPTPVAPAEQPPVITETAQLETDRGKNVDEPDVSRATAEDQAAGKADEVECWFDLPYEVLFSGDTEQMVTTASDTDEEMEQLDVETGVELSADEAMSLEDILMTIPAYCPLPSAIVEITKITLGKSISIPVVNEGDWYKASLPKIPATDKGKAPLQIRDPVKGKPPKEIFSLILADIECLVQLKEQVIDEVDKFFNSFSFKKLPHLKIKEISAKEALILSWAETDLRRVALQRRSFILKYRELLIRKFLEARKINFAPGDGSSATKLKVLDWLSDIHSFVLDELKEQMMTHGLRWKKPCCSQVFEGRTLPRPVSPVISWRLYQLCTAFVQYSLFSGLSTADISSFVSTIAFERTMLRDVQIAQSSISVAPSVQMMIDQSPFSSSTSDDSSMHFDDNDTADTSISLPPATTDVMEYLAKLRASVDQVQLLKFEMSNYTIVLKQRKIISIFLPNSVSSLIISEEMMPKMGKVVAATPNHLLTIKADPAGEVVAMAIEQMYRDVVLGKVVAEVEVVADAIGVDLPREDIPAVMVDRSEDRLKIG
ncbi:hypothetical protein F511_37692 [Dorcoceras hygrometricum]|uniref:Uncharacterized protein n=1 Tax=Dorcoceras hygrometricum TaxID=472368 RepID=A0A2Z7BEG6_9LAMI|nr:hypothetical protein F511_37692 [Dorcoceras hygrometricum]